MPIKGRDKEFRCQKVTFLEFNHTEMDRVLTMLFPRLKFNGHASRKPPRANILKADEFIDEILKGPRYAGDIDLRQYFKGFEELPDILEKWIETDLLDVVNRGKPNQAVASLRPLHGETYKFRNAKYCRDYGASEQLYWMIYFARKGRGQAARDALKRFFFPGIDLITDKYDDRVSVDVETQALLRFNQQVETDMRDSKTPQKETPLCIGQADLLADDILRILAYEPYIPRSVLVEYIKVLLSFHLAIYHLKLLKILPKMVKQESGNPLCTSEHCPVEASRKKVFEECPFKISMVVDMDHGNTPHLSEMARRSADHFYRQIPAFVQANYTIKKLDEMADYLTKKTGKLEAPEGGAFSVGELAELLSSKYAEDREAYFKFRLAGLIEESSAGADDVDPEIREVMAMKLNDFDAFIEILMAYRGKYHKQYITECIDSLLLKNKDSGLLAQARTKGSPRRFVLGSKLLEVLLQLAVLTQKGSAFVTRELQIEELLVFLYERYGICIDRLPSSRQNSSILDKRALRLNLEAFKRRLREIGFYEDLSDAYITQKITPRYQIART